MAASLSNLLVVGISSRALFDLEEEEAIYQDAGLASYRAHQLAHENAILKPGVGFALVRALQNLNALATPDSTVPVQRLVEVVIMSRNSSETSLRIFNSIAHYGLDITRAVLSGGAPLAPYLQAFNVSLFLSLHEDDVQAAIDAGTAAALLYRQTAGSPELKAADQIRIAFDGDAVLFSDESERIYQTQGIEAFERHERENACKPLPEGPFARLLKALSLIQTSYQGTGPSPIRTALVTARSSPAHERVIRTLRIWHVVIDETFFMGGVSKSAVLAAFRPHMFFDDQHGHCEGAASLVPTGRVFIKQT